MTGIRAAYREVVKRGYVSVMPVKFRYYVYVFGGSEKGNLFTLP